jgi:hypothetical protein
MKFRDTKQSLFILSLFLLSSSISQSQHLGKTADAIGTLYTDVGQIGLTITNYGTLGTRNSSWPNQPSCVYPSGSLIEHMYQGGLWIGARLRNAPDNSIRVTTGASDRSSTSSGAGFEFTTEIGSAMTERSTLSNSRYFQENAISHQDFLAGYTDRHTRIPVSSGIGDTIPGHYPLGVNVHQESYAWNFPYTNSFVIISYTITNINTDTLDDVYAGIWCDNVVRNTNYVRPGIGGTYFAYCGNGYDSLARMMYTYEANPYPGSVQANSYIGVALLGTTPFPDSIAFLRDLYRQTYYNAWFYQSSSATQAFLSPTDDYTSANPYLSRYTRMSQSIPQSAISTVHGNPGNYTTLISTGPWKSLLPGDSIQVVIAVVCADNANKALPEGRDDTTQRAYLKGNLLWAQRCYDGEDTNGNDSLDAGEDIVTRVPGGLIPGGDGKLTRYVLPTPPTQPRVHAEVGDRSAIIYWDKSAEYSRDPITGEFDFEGYRVYRTKAGADFLDNASWLLNMPLVGDFDRTDDTVGYNTGFKQIVIDTSAGFAGITFAGDTTHYFYRFPPASNGVTQLNGWQYAYGVSAYDRGDPAINLTSLESAVTKVTTISGTKSASDPSREIGVYPNPYYGSAYWDGAGERTRKIYFTNLPANATITIYTIAGDIVAQLDHSASNAGTNIKWFQQFSGTQMPIFSGGEHAWDLISKYDQAIATGLYLFTVKDKDTGAVKRGKFLVIK